MTPEHFRNIQIPRVGRELGRQPGPAGEAYQAANEAYQVVMVGLAKLIGVVFVTAFCVTLVVIIGYGLAGWAGAFVLAAVIGMVSTRVIRSG